MLLGMAGREIGHDRAGRERLRGARENR